VAITPSGPVRRRASTPDACRLQSARRCYDHLAGRLGVAVTAALVDRGFIAPVAGKRYEIPPAGVEWFGTFGIDLTSLRAGRLGLARQCLDWTEREHHLAGPLGVALLRTLCDKRWLIRSDQDRALQLTRAGRKAFRIEIGIDAELLR
jgi:hypothetical protein